MSIRTGIVVGNRRLTLDRYYADGGAPADEVVITISDTLIHAGPSLERSITIPVDELEAVLRSAGLTP